MLELFDNHAHYDDEKFNEDRDEVIRKFKYDFDKGFLKPFDNIEKNALSLKGKIIACHCKPYACHGDVIADYVNSLDDGE